MGCSGSKDEVRQIEIKKTGRQDEEAIVSEKSAAINNIFAKPEPSEEGEILPPEPPKKKDFARPKLNLVKRKGPAERNVNLLIEDNTKVFELH